ncbi:MAG: NAD(+) synthetase [Epsilonproteobacteria bacterium]|jgi:NAD+ synthase|nr:NAD(+) synthetase [Campylobacterota bacterium]NPA88725.1 NAD+ synthase [Campylobacterota bacterium]
MGNSKWELVEKYLVRFIREEIEKTHLLRGICGLSGGIDSAVVAILARKALGRRFKAILMPSQYSSPQSVADAEKLCKKFDIPYEIVSIAPLLEAYPIKNKLRLGNFSARMRMAILYDKSAQYKGLVIGTSNKTELLLGYGTLCGDLASALNPIGDLYKTEIFEFARYLGVIEEILNKPPSADLWQGQSDEKELGYSYEEIDPVLMEFVDNRATQKELMEKFDRKLVEFVVKKVYQNQFKRKMPIIAKLKNRTITHDFLYERDIRL